MCDRDCFHCVKPDCDNDDLTTDEYMSQDVRDRFARYEGKYGTKRKIADYEKSESGKARQKKYEESEKGKETRKKHRESEEYKEARRKYYASKRGKTSYRERYLRYKQTEAGKEAIRRRNHKAVASGKNAEYCRAYYQRKKEKQLQELFEGMRNELSTV